MDALLSDLRYAVRSLRNSPGFTATVVLTLGLGIGVNITVFSLANWIVLRPVPGVLDQDRLVLVEFRDGQGSPTGVSYPNLADLVSQVPALSGLAGQLWSPVAIRAGDLPAEQVQAMFVSADYFRVLGGAFLQGRSFTRDEEVAAATSPVAVISDRLWQSVVGGSPETTGRTIMVNGIPTAVVGVAPARFRGTELMGQTELWIPASAWGTLRRIRGARSPIGNRQVGVLMQLVGRLAGGATPEQAESQFRAAAASLVAAYPVENTNWRDHLPTVFAGIGVSIRAREPLRRALVLLTGVAGLVLLIACANVANLFLCRGVIRREGLAVRRALGASPGRVVRGQLAECTLVSLIAGVLALLLAWGIAGLFRGPVLPDLGEVRDFKLDWRVLGFAVSLALATAVLFGVVPAAAAVRTDVLAGLKIMATRMSSVGAQLRAGLAAVQVSLSLSLLVVSFLLIGTLRNLRRIDVGFDADRVTGFTIGLGEAGGHRPDESRVILREAVTRIRAIPGVDDVSLSAYSPFTFSMGNNVRGEDDAAANPLQAVTDGLVSGAYFRTMGIPLRAGRTFRDDELFGSMQPVEGVAVITETLSRRLFGSGDPIGRIVRSRWLNSPFRVVGVVGDSRWATLVNEGTGPLWYRPIPAPSLQALVVLVRSRLPLRDLQAAVQGVMGSLAPTVPVSDVERLSTKIDRLLAQERLLARVLTGFATLAVLLAAVGLYAVVSFSVAQRTRELGIRIALGAGARQIFAMVLGQGAQVGTVGVLLGLGGAAGLSRVIASRLYGLTPLEPGIYVVATALLFALVLVASVVPAHRATRVDPMVALRAE